MEWVESPGKGRNTSTLLQFARLWALDRIVLDTSKVLLFIKSVDPLGREKVGLLLETNNGLTADWVVVKKVCSHFYKQREWNDQEPSAAGPMAGKKPIEPIPTRSEETRRWLESGAVPTDVVKGPTGGATLKELTKMMHDLQICQARRDDGG